MAEIRVTRTISRRTPQGEVTCEPGLHSEELLRELLGEALYAQLLADGTLIPEGD